MNQSVLPRAGVAVSVPSSIKPWALVALALSMLLSSLATSMANVALPALVAAFSAPFGVVQWVVLAYLVTLTASVVGAGRLGDVLGRRALLRGGLAVFTGAALVCGLAPGLWLVLGARAVQGAAAAAMMALPLALVGEVVPAERTGGAMGLLGTTSAVGTALGPSLGGVLIGWLGWRAPFLVQVPLGLLALYLAGRALPAGRRSDAAKLDVPGTVLLALTLSFYALAVTLGRGHFGAVNGALGLGAVVSGALLVRTERRVAAPLLSAAMFRSRATLASLAASLLVSAVVMATLVVGPFHLSRALGLDAVEVGLVLSVGPLVAALVGVPSGRLVDGLGTRRAVRLGLFAVGAGAAGLSAAAGAPGVPGYVAPVAVLTAGYALFQAANNTAVLRDAALEQRGLASATLTLSRNLGLVTGASVMGALFALGAGGGDVATATADAVAAGTRLTFGAAVGLIGLAALALEGRPGGAR